MKKLLTALCVTTAGLLATAHAAAFPGKTVILSGPYSTGTGADWIVRLSAPKVSALWNVPVVTENNVGASGAIGTLATSKVAPNGQTFSVMSTTHGAASAMRSKLLFDPHTFVPVVLLGTGALTLEVGGDSPMKSYQDFVHTVQKLLGDVAYALSESRSPQHLAEELLSQEVALKLLHFSYRETAGALKD